MNWTDREIKELKILRNEKKKSFKDIASKLNRSIGSVRSKYERNKYTTEEIAKNRKSLLKADCYNKEFNRRQIEEKRKEDKRFKKASIYLIFFPYTSEMKVGVSNSVDTRRAQFGLNITILSYVSLPIDRYIAEFTEGYILNKFKDYITYSNTLKVGGNTELFTYNINNIDNLINEIDLIIKKALIITPI